MATPAKTGDRKHRHINVDAPFDSLARTDFERAKNGKNPQDALRIKRGRGRALAKLPTSPALEPMSSREG